MRYGSRTKNRARLTRSATRRTFTALLHMEVLLLDFSLGASHPTTEREMSANKSIEVKE
jgi:hypothetical protein